MLKCWGIDKVTDPLIIAGHEEQEIFPRMPIK